MHFINQHKEMQNLSISGKIIMHFTDQPQKIAHICMHERILKHKVNVHKFDNP